jgi:hypothetical protein
MALDSINEKELLEKKISKVLKELEKKAWKEKWILSLVKINSKLEKINKPFQKRWLEIASKINTNSDLNKIFDEFKKYKYKKEVLEILTKQIKFKLKESYYDSALKEFLEVK